MSAVSVAAVQLSTLDPAFLLTASAFLPSESQFTGLVASSKEAVRAIRASASIAVAGAGDGAAAVSETSFKFNPRCFFAAVKAFTLGLGQVRRVVVVVAVGALPRMIDTGVAVDSDSGG